MQIVIFLLFCHFIYLTGFSARYIRFIFQEELLDIRFFIVQTLMKENQIFGKLKMADLAESSTVVLSSVPEEQKEWRVLL